MLDMTSGTPLLWPASLFFSESRERLTLWVPSSCTYLLLQMELNWNLSSSVQACQQEEILEDLILKDQSCVGYRVNWERKEPPVILEFTEPRKWWNQRLNFILETVQLWWLLRLLQESGFFLDPSANSMDWDQMWHVQLSYSIVSFVFHYWYCDVLGPVVDIEDEAIDKTQGFHSHRHFWGDQRNNSFSLLGVKANTKNQ